MPVAENTNASWGIAANDNVLANFGLKNLSNQGSIRNFRMNAYFERAIRAYVESKIKARRYSHSNPIGYLQGFWDGLTGSGDFDGGFYIGTGDKMLEYYNKKLEEAAAAANLKKAEIEKMKLSGIKLGLELKKAKSNAATQNLIFGGYSNYAGGSQYSEGGAGSQTFTAISALNRSRGFDELSNDEIINAALEASVQNRGHITAAGCASYFENTHETPYPLLTKWTQQQVSQPTLLKTALNHRLDEIKNCISELCTLHLNYCGEALSALEYAVFHPSGAGVLIRQVAAALEREQMENYNNALRCKVVEWESPYKYRLKEGLNNSKKTAEEVYNEEQKKQEEMWALKELVFTSDAYTLDEKAAFYYASAYTLVSELSDAFDAYTDDETGASEAGEFYGFVGAAGITINDNQCTRANSWAGFRANVLKGANSDNLTEVLTKNEICQIAREVMASYYSTNEYFNKSNGKNYATASGVAQGFSLRGYFLQFGYLTMFEHNVGIGWGGEFNHWVWQAAKELDGGKWMIWANAPTSLLLYTLVPDPAPDVPAFLNVLAQSYKFPAILEGYDFDKIEV